MEIGFLGKIASYPDFIEYGVSTSFRERWSRWLDNGVAESRVQLGEAWLDVYIISPVWRFALAPGTCGDDARVGLMMPSVDSVGRYFPLTITLSIPSAFNLPFALDTAGDWLRAAEFIARESLDGKSSVASIRGALEALPQPYQLSEKTTARFPCTSLGSTGGNSWNLVVESPESDAVSSARLAGEVLTRYISQTSVWLSAGSDGVEPSLVVCDGLPQPSCFRAMMDGEWLRRELT
jgi:type VI secretion system protein ImpM